MSVKESEALVLKSYNLSESDKIVVFFTRGYGLVRGVAKGARRLNSKFGSSLEPFSTVTISYFQKEERELVSIQSAEISHSRFDLVANIAYLDVFSYIAELLIDFSPPHDADETLYRMIDACLGAASGADRLDAVKLYFEIWLLRLAGYLPDWSRCDTCRKEIDRTQGAALASGFHLRCANCRGRTGLNLLAPEDIELFRCSLAVPPSEFCLRSAAIPAALQNLSSIMKRMIAQVLGRNVAEPAGLR